MHQGSNRKTNMKKILLAALLTAILNISSGAQTTGSGRNDNSREASTDSIPTRFWKASLPGGEYMVALDRISSVAKHTYVVDGAARVYEVTVADSSSAIARFYYIEPVTDKSPLNVGQVVLDRVRGTAKEATKRVGAGDVWDQVVKNYPQTTHARTMEYRFNVRSNIDSLYTSITRAWERKKGEQFSVSSK